MELVNLGSNPTWSSTYHLLAFTNIFTGGKCKSCLLDALIKMHLPAVAIDILAETRMVTDHTSRHNTSHITYEEDSDKHHFPQQIIQDKIGLCSSH
jgi:hypothetical protein